jgi:hypothetical protein
MSDADNVKVAVRVRPFNDREKKMGARNCITMDPATQQTIIANLEDGVFHAIALACLC